MLQSTRKADYGLRLMLEVGGSPGDATTTAEAAQRQPIPCEFLRKVAQTPVSHGLLVSESGVRGGLTLAWHLLPAALTAQRRWSTASHGGSSNVT